MAVSRWGVFRTLGSALRTATRPGSPSLGERIASLPRLVRATLRGEYAGTTKSRLLLIAAAIAYVVSPFDLMPEALLAVFGLADDAMVMSWIAAAIINETEEYLSWERSTGRGHPFGRADTVPGRVVR